MMLEAIETLIALEKYETMTKTARYLHITQSAVSKRIQALEDEVGNRLIVPHGRRVMLSAHGKRLAEELRPLVSKLRGVLLSEETQTGSLIRIGVADSVLSSWGAKILKKVKTKMPDLILEIHTHQSTGVIGRVMEGVYHLGIVSGRCEVEPDLWTEQIGEEDLVILPAGLEKMNLNDRRVPVLSIDPYSATWKSIAHRMRSLKIMGQLLSDFRIIHLESYSCMVQMSIQGFGHAFLPAGVCLAAKVPRQKIFSFPGNHVNRPVSFVAREKTLQLGIIQKFMNQFRDSVGVYLEKQSASLRSTNQDPSK